MTSKREAARVSASSTGRSKMVLSGSGPAYQRSESVTGSRNASPYLCPADRREAASASIWNQGWCCKARTNCWPTTPVAPTMAAFNIDVASSSTVLLNSLLPRGEGRDERLCLHILPESRLRRRMGFATMTVAAGSDHRLGATEDAMHGYHGRILHVNLTNGQT